MALTFADEPLVSEGNRIETDVSLINEPSTEPTSATCWASSAIEST
jgi:hypothetical protein